MIGNSMAVGKIFFVISDEIEKNFRAKADKRFDDKKGALSKAAEEAFTKWLQEEE
jgi:hypothetical protein